MSPTPLLRVHACGPVQAASLGSPDCNFCESHALTYSTFAECYGAEAGFIPQVGCSCSLGKGAGQTGVVAHHMHNCVSTDNNQHPDLSDCGRNCKGNHTLVLLQKPCVCTSCC